MISLRSALAGVLALCALSICAFAAASTSASELTAVTCKKIGGAGNSDSHCTTGSSGEYKTEVLPLNTTTEVEGTSTEAEPTLRATLGGSNFTVKCQTAHLLSGSVENIEPSAGKHSIVLVGIFTDTACHAVLKSNEARFCAVEGITGGAGAGQIKTVELKGTTTGTEHQLKVEPVAGTLLTEFKILKKGSSATENECWTAANLTVKVEGSVEGEASTPNHSHLTFTEAKNGSNLKVGGAEAKYIDTLGGNMKGEAAVTVGEETFT